MGKVITDSYSPFDKSPTPIRAISSVKETEYKVYYFEQWTSFWIKW